MPLFSKNISNAWQEQNAWIKTSDTTWSATPQIYVKTSSGWKPLYKYQWEIGSWGGCSAACGGGVQTRSVRCKRQDGKYYSDSFCISQVGAKPITSQSCNTHSCTYRMIGHVDDCGELYTRPVYNTSQGWRCITPGGCPYCGASDFTWEISSPDFGTTNPTPMLWHFWDTNGTSYHTGLKLCNSANACSEQVMEIGKQGSCGGAKFYFTWSASNNAIQRVRCARRDDSCIEGCSGCTDSGWGYLNCAGGYPAWARS